MSERLNIFLRSISYTALGVAIALAIVVAWMVRQPDPEPAVGQVVKATPSKVVAKVEKKDATPKKPVKVYKDGAAVKGKLELPREIVENQAEEVVSSSTLDGHDDHPKTITTTINLDTGEFETYVKREPKPWLAWDDRGYAKIGIGVKNWEPAIRLEAHQDMVDVKSLRFGGTGSVDITQSGKTDWMLMGDVGYYW